MGQSGTSVKDQGSHDLASEYGTQRACLEAFFSEVLVICASAHSTQSI